jgi:hypothetical protein
MTMKYARPPKMTIEYVTNMRLIAAYIPAAACG